MRWQHFDELEADFQQYFNLDVTTVTPARAARLLFQLPTDCRVYSVLYPANKWGWSEVLLNKANYMLEVLAWQKANEGVAKSKQTEKPVLFVPEFMKPPKDLKDVEVHDTDDIRRILAQPRA